MLGIGKGLRFGFGYDIGHTLKGLARVDETLAELAAVAEPGPVPLETITPTDAELLEGPVDPEAPIEPIEVDAPDAPDEVFTELAMLADDTPIPDVGGGA